jgi:hypothetical protein
MATKQRANPAKSWKFQLNSRDNQDIDNLKSLIEEHTEWGILCQKPDYIQGYVSFKERVRFISKMGDNPNIVSSTFNVSKVQKKLRDFALDDCKTGEILYMKNLTKPTDIITIDRDNFYDWQEELVQLLEIPCKWDDRTIYWRYGGFNIGKSQFSRWLCVHLGAVVIGGEKRHMLSQVQNADAPIYVILLPKGDNKVSYRAIEQIKDGLFASSFGCDNNKMTIRNAPHILIIGNDEPNYDDRNYHPTKYNVAKVSSPNEEFVDDTPTVSPKSQPHNEEQGCEYEKPDYSKCIDGFD